MLHRDGEAGLKDMLRSLESDKAPGGILAVIEKGAIVFQGAFGMADLSRGVKNTVTTVLGAASLAKQFTAASIALLAEEGFLRLDQDIRHYLPELPDYGFAVTIGHLVDHTGGLKDYRGLLEDTRESYGTREALEAIASFRELDFPPGERFQYCNSGYVLLAEIVHRAAGITLDRFVKTRIFLPLGMRKSSLGAPGAFLKCATGYALSGISHFEAQREKERTLGPGGLFTTLGDLAKWDSFWCGKSPLPCCADGGERLRRLILTRGRLNNGEVLTYAFGLAVWSYRGTMAVSHEGGAGGFRADMVRFPDLGFTVACLCNNDGINPVEITRKAADVMLRSV
ncbi:MAG: serine hydrolase domain-containing protein [Candidatus Eremiobacteraeota bacterium]|nr:serine hydrolase domain-containing protein [Candidatus Eremiobacteraeota bacterium]